MANIASSKKDARRSAVRAVRNRGLKASVKTKITKVRRALHENDDEATQLGLGAISALDRAAAKGVLHRNNAARRKSRLMKRLAAAGAQAKAGAPAKAAKKTPAKKAPAKKAPAKKAPAKKKA
jgi:small subunit ribosomal protein S20